jgi:hypothetical protein
LPDSPISSKGFYAGVSICIVPSVAEYEILTMECLTFVSTPLPSDAILIFLQRVSASVSARVRIERDDLGKSRRRMGRRTPHSRWTA